MTGFVPRKEQRHGMHHEVTVTKTVTRGDGSTFLPFCMPVDLFSASGISAWRRRLNQSSAFAEAASSWTGRLLLVEHNDRGVRRSTWVVVGQGRCAEARIGLPSDELSADYVLSASPQTWMDLITARHTPATAALLGRLTLLKGSVMSLIPHAKAAAELLAAAAGGAP